MSYLPKLREIVQIAILACTFSGCANTYDRTFVVSGQADNESAFEALYSLPTKNGAKRKIYSGDRYAKVFALRPAEIQRDTAFDPNDVLEVRLGHGGNLELLYLRVGATQDFQESALEQLNMVLRGIVDSKTGAAVEIKRKYHGQ